MSRIYGKEMRWLALCLLGCVAGIAFAFWLGHVARSTWVEVLAAAFGMIVFIAGVLCSAHCCDRRNERLLCEATAPHQAAFDRTVSRLTALGMPTDVGNLAARPDSVGRIQISAKDVTFRICEHYLVSNVRLTQVIEVGGTPMRNDLGIACFICGAFRENPQASFAGTLAPALLGRNNLLEVISELEAKHGIIPDVAADAALERREAELNAELAKIQAKRQVFAFSRGRALEPKDPYK